MNLPSLAALFLAGFAIVFPLVSAPTRWGSTQNAFWALLVAATVATLLLVLRLRSEPLRWTSGHRIASVLGLLSLAYVLGLLGATYGILRPDFVFFAPLSFGIAVALLRPEFLQTVISGRVRVALTALVLVATVACLLTAHQHIALLGSHNRRTGLLTLLGCVTLFLLAVTFVRSDRSTARILAAMLWGAVLVSILALWQFFDPGASARSWFYDLYTDSRPMGTMGHPNWLGTYLCLLLPIATALYLGARTQFTQISCAISSLLIFASLVVCQTRGAWVATACFLVWLAIRHRAAWRNLLPLFVGFGLMVVILLPCKDWEILRRVASFGGEIELASEGSPGTGSSRFGYWIYGVKHLPPHLLLGAGLDTFEEIGRHDPTPPPIDKAHSISLEYAVTLGLPGLALYLYFLLACIRSTPGNSESLIRWGLKASIVTYLIQGFFIHDTIPSWPLVWVIAGLAAVREEFSVAPISQTPPKP